MNHPIDLTGLQFSLLLITPKRPFLDWLAQYNEGQGIGDYDTRLPEEDTVWIIPKLEMFTGPNEFPTYLEAVKPKLLLSELYRFGATERDFPEPITAESFDEYFETAIRTNADLITDLV